MKIIIHYIPLKQHLIEIVGVNFNGMYSFGVQRIGLSFSHCNRGGIILLAGLISLTQNRYTVFKNSQIDILNVKLIGNTFMPRLHE